MQKLTRKLKSIKRKKQALGVLALKQLIINKQKRNVTLSGDSNVSSN